MKSRLRLLITAEQHFHCAADGYFYGIGPTSYSFFKRYLEAFDEVLVLARVALGGEARHSESRADGPGVTFRGLADFHGPWQYFRNLAKLRTQVRAAVASCDAYILRGPGLTSRLAWREISRIRRPYALEVVCDPWDGLGPRMWPSTFRPVYRRVAVAELKQMCWNAVAVHYVTESALQRRYPAGENTYAVGLSDAQMDSAFAAPPAIEAKLRRFDELGSSGSQNGKPLQIGFLGTLVVPYKGLDVLLHAGSLCRDRSLEFEIAVAGEGRYAGRMQRLAERLELRECTHFFGQLPFGEGVLNFLDSVDLFVMPSYAEGLPRAMLEAMARGCACIGSDVGGIPELLAPEDLVPVGDPEALARKILEVVRDPQRMRAMSCRNLKRAADFSPDKLRNAYRDFCRFVRTCSEADLRNKMLKFGAQPCQP